jgi:hypothetical protein
VGLEAVIFTLSPAFSEPTSWLDLLGLWRKLLERRTDADCAVQAEHTEQTRTTTPKIFHIKLSLVGLGSSTFPGAENLTSTAK